MWWCSHMLVLGFGDHHHPPCPGPLVLSTWHYLELSGGRISLKELPRPSWPLSMSVRDDLHCSLMQEIVMGPSLRTTVATVLVRIYVITFERPSTRAVVTHRLSLLGVGGRSLDLTWDSSPCTLSCATLISGSTMCIECAASRGSGVVPTLL